MAATAITQSGCDSKKLSAVILNQEALIGREINTEDMTLPTYLNSRIPHRGSVEPYDNHETMVTKQAVAGALPFAQLNTDLQPLIDGSMEALGACSNGQVVRMASQVVPTDANACEGVQLVDFAQGFYFNGYSDWEIKIATKQRCVETLANQKRSRVKQIINQERRNFVQTGVNSTDHHLVNLVIANGEANASVQSIQEEVIPKLTKGGWHKPPSGHITIPFLEGYRDEIKRRKKSNGHLKRGQQLMLEFEMTYDAWKIAKAFDKLYRTSKGGVFCGLDKEIDLQMDMEDSYDMLTEGMLAGRQFENWQNKFRVVFDDEPIRGYLRPNSQTVAGKVLYDFIRIMPIINVPADQQGNQIEGYDAAGLIPISNPDYDSTFVNCGGSYRVLELIPHIDKDSFARYGLQAGIGPDGKRTQGVNWDVRLLQGEYLSSKECPDFFDGYYQYAARYRMRWQNVRPEYSGFIIHQRGFFPKYDIDDTQLCVQERRFGLEAEVCATPAELEQAEIQSCDVCPEDVVCDEANDVITFEACGEQIPVHFFGVDDTNLLLIKVCREGACGTGAATVDYAFVDGTALLDTHYEVVDAAGVKVAETGTLTWEEGENGCKFLCVKILGALADDADTVDACCNEVEGAKNIATFEVQLSSATNSNVAACASTSYGIVNYA